MIKSSFKSSICELSVSGEINYLGVILQPAVNHYSQLQINNRKHTHYKVMLPTLQLIRNKFEINDQKAAHYKLTY